jgi:DNA-3-methyladenine glycosylase
VTTVVPRGVSDAALPPAFYERPVLEVASDLVGCSFLFDGVGGRIVETEAYRQDDERSHSFIGRTRRNAVMFGPPGRLYVYFTYGMHFCCNLVCGPEGEAAAVLLRALEPRQGLELMRERRGRGALRRGVPDDRLLCSGPARLAQALGIEWTQNGLAAWIEPLVVLPRDSEEAPRIAVTPRIGVGGDPKPWRFVDADSPYLSRRLPPSTGR